MIDFHAAQVRGHRRNIERYCRLLATDLTDLERQYLHTRAEENTLSHVPCLTGRCLMRHSRASRRLPPSPAKKAPFHGHFTQSFRPKTRCLMCPVSRALSHEAPPFVPEGAASDRKSVV